VRREDLAVREESLKKSAGQVTLVCNQDESAGIFTNLF
jgi:hypothetical protein